MFNLCFWGGGDKISSKQKKSNVGVKCGAINQ